MTPTGQQLKAAMEEVWAASRISNPLRPAHWRVVSYRDSHTLEDREPFVFDEDDGDPLDPADAR
jgi:hypothetical protein